MFQILVVEDDTNTRKLMCILLKKAGYEPIPAVNGCNALEIMDSCPIDLVVLDIMMPEMDGYQLTEALRSCNYELPILMVSAKQLQEDKKRGFLVGIDDYMTKPIDEEEFLLRIKALLRRARIVDTHRLQIGTMELDYDSLSVTRGSTVQTLPQKEFYLLYLLLSYPGKVFTRAQLMDEIWGYDSESTDNTIPVHINRLRCRFMNCSEFSIVTVRGLGYKAVKYDED